MLRVVDQAGNTVEMRHHLFDVIMIAAETNDNSHIITIKRNCLMVRILVFTLLYILSQLGFADQPILTVKKKGGHTHYEFTNPPMKRTRPQQPRNLSDYSAHIIDIDNGRIEAAQTTCEDIKNHLRQMYRDIFKNKFYYSIQLDCYPVHSRLQFEFRSLISPTDEIAVQVTENFIKQWDGANFFGSKISFQYPKAMLFTTVVTIGESLPVPKTLLRHFYTITTNRYDNLFEVMNAMSDFFYHFEPRNEATLPVFLKLFPADGEEVLAALRQSNSLELFGYPTILYGEKLKEYVTVVGQQEMLMTF